jgi:regulator of replication initiation timing
MPNDQGHPSTSGEGGGQHLTYAQIALRLGISNEAARQLVRRRGWRRIRPNRMGAPALVVVPDDDLTAEQWREPRPTLPYDRGSPPFEPPVDAGPTGNVTRLEAAIAALTEALARADKRADDAVTRAHALRDQLEELRMQLARATGSAEAEHGRAEQAESRAEAAEADRRAAEARAETAVARADGLRDQVEGLRIKLTELEAEGHAQTVEAAELSARIKATETAQAEAEAHAAELRQADKERRAGGRWARLRAAWGGE